MFRRNSDEEYDEIIREKQSQIVNSSIDYQYMGDAFDNEEPRPKSSYHSEVGIKEQMFSDDSFLKKCKTLARLVLIIEVGFKKLNQNIDMLISSQKVCSDLLSFQKIGKPLDFEL